MWLCKPMNWPCTVNCCWVGGDGIEGSGICTGICTGREILGGRDTVPGLRCTLLAPVAPAASSVGMGVGVRAAISVGLGLALGLAWDDDGVRTAGGVLVAMVEEEAVTVVVTGSVAVAIVSRCAGSFDCCTVHTSIWPDEEEVVTVDVTGGLMVFMMLLATLLPLLLLLLLFTITAPATVPAVPAVVACCCCCWCCTMDDGDASVVETAPPDVDNGLAFPVGLGVSLFICCRGQGEMMHTHTHTYTDIM